jgi:hypothetical protein
MKQWQIEHIARNRHKKTLDDYFLLPQSSPLDF